jgi:hypothetical protein
MSFQRRPAPSFRDEVWDVFVDPDLPLVARVDEVVVERAQQDPVLDIRGWRPVEWCSSGSAASS